jgi:hypothetical protein
MYEGKQVVRFVNNYKSKDLYNIGNEMDKRKGTGNYDDERTKFNIHYKDIKEKSLYQEVKNILENRNIEYLHKTKTNMLNGVTFTSGPEFFQTLGLPFKKSGRTYQSGDKEGQDILVPDIKSKDDIPEEVINYFDSCMEYLKSLVGEENIVMAHVHFDEDTPHLQAYFLPVVNEVKRKCFKRDSNGELIKEKVIGSNGKEKEVPILLRDSNNNIVYETVKGNFLNNDQFWKDLGGKNSFATIQDSFNKFINDKGYKLDRGKVGSNKKHQTKLEHQIEELKNEISNLWKDVDNYNDKLKKSKEILQNSSKEELNIKKNFVGYSAKEVEKLIDYSNNLKRINDINKYELESKDSKIFSLTHENEFYKNNKELINIRKYSHEKDNELRDKKTEVDYLNKALNTITRAFDIKLNRKPMLYISDYVKLSKEIINANRNINNEMDKASEDFHKLFEQEK